MHERFGAFAGAESNILNTANELRKRGCATAILHGPSTNRGLDAWRTTFSSRFELLSGGPPGESVPASIKAFQPDVIYVHKLADPDALNALLGTGVPLVRMVHDHDLYCMRSYKYNLFTRNVCDRALSPYCLFPCGAFVARRHEPGLPLKWVSYSSKVRELELNRSFDCMVVATQYMREELVRNGFVEEKIEIHPPVPRLDEDAPQSSFSDRNLIIYSGQITRGKGVDVLLGALARVTQRFECLIFGEGNYRHQCEKLSRAMGLSDRVRFEGYVSPELIAERYRECSVAVMSSVWPEPFGAAGLEAMCYGVPVVAFDAGGIKEWLMDGVTGFLAPWMDEVRYAQRVDNLLRDEGRARRMGANARRAVRECFSFSEYIDGLENLFTRLAARSQAALT